MDSYYSATAVGLVDYPKLVKLENCDVCVVGGGYCGLSTALNLAEYGYDTVLVEANKVGWGASGRNGGQLGSGMNLSQSEIERRFGVERALLFWEISEQAKEVVKNRIAHHQIPCDFKPGVLNAALTSDVADCYKSEVALLKEKYNASDVRFVGREEMQDMLGSARYWGGLLSVSAGHLHPLNLAIGLAHAAADAGVRIYENSPLMNYSQNNAGYKLTVGSGVVKSKFIVLTCNAYIDDVAPSISRLIMPIESFIAATEPLPDSVTKNINRDDVAVCDSRHCLDYYRLSADRRLLFGGSEKYIPDQKTDIKALIQPRLLSLYPQLEGTKIDYAWGGRIAITINRLPSVGRMERNVFYAQGFSGHGVALANMTGKILADAIDGESTQFNLLASIRHREFPGGKLMRWPNHLLGMLYYNLCDRVEMRKWADRA